MASQEKASTTLAANKTDAPAKGAIIENELPTYRAVDRLAVVSAVLGIFSVFCFANLYFLAVAAAAVIIGILTDRRISRLSAELTGRGLRKPGSPWA